MSYGGATHQSLQRVHAAHLAELAEEQKADEDHAKLLGMSDLIDM